MTKKAAPKEPIRLSAVPECNPLKNYIEVSLQKKPTAHQAFNYSRCFSMMFKRRDEIARLTNWDFVV